MDGYWRLDGHTPVPCTVEEWAETSDRRLPGEKWRVARTTIGDFTVSTVFLGLDHSFMLGGPPELFETMVFGLGADEEYQERCSTWEQAEMQHAEAVAWAEAHR